MSHHIYTTQAFVLDSNLTGEANKFYTLLTKDLGLVRASAQGVRLQKSKLRPNLQEYSLVKISLVKGKEIWRITSCILISDIYFKFKSEKYLIQSLVRIFSLVRRLAGAEQKDEFLFEILHKALEYLEKNKISQEDSAYLELFIVINILEKLGYMPNERDMTKFVGVEITPEILEDVKKIRREAVIAVNNALRETQL